MKHPDGTRCEMPDASTPPSKGEHKLSERIAEREQPQGDMNDRGRGEPECDRHHDTPTRQTENRRQRYCYRARKRGRRIEACIRRHSRTIEAISAAIIAAFTIALCLVSNRQWGTMRDALRRTDENNAIARDAAHAAKASAVATRDQMRAYEAVEGAQLGVLEPAFNFDWSEVVITLENYGHIASRKTRGMFTIYGQEGDWFEKPTIPQTTRQFGGDFTEVGPGPERRHSEAVEVDNLDEAAVKGSQVSLNVIVVYDNGFGQMTQGSACFTFNLPGGGQPWGPARVPYTWTRRPCGVMDFSSLTPK